MNKKKLFQSPDILLFIFIALYIAAALLGLRQFWGINFAKFLPGWWAWLTASILVLVLIPPISQKISNCLNVWSDRLHQNRQWRIAFLALFSLEFLILSIVFRQKTFFLGDGILRLNLISNNDFLILEEMGDLLIHSAVYRIFLAPSGLPPETSYLIVSSLSGIIFIVGAFRLARYLYPAQLLLIWLAMITSGLMVMFFGYVESYAIVAGLIPHLILSALQVIDGKSGKTKFIVSLILAGFIHAIALILFSGILLIVLFNDYINSANAAKRLSKYLTLTLIILTFIFYIARYSGILPVENILVSIIPTTKNGYAVFTANYALNIINWILLSGLSAPIIFSAARVFSNDDSGEHSYKRVSFSYWIAVPSILFVLLFIPHLGGARDWDLFSPAVFMLIPAALIAFFARGYRPLPVQAVPSIILSFIIAISFVAVNSSKDASVRRFEEVIEVTGTGSLFNEYAMLYCYADENPFLRGKRFDYALMAWRQPAFEKKDTLYIASQLARLYLDTDDKMSARLYLNHALDADPTDLNINLLLADFYRKYGFADSLLGLAAKMQTVFSGRALGLMNAGIIFLENNHTERGGLNLVRAFELDSSDSRVILNYGIYCYQINDFERCIQLFGRLPADNPDNFPAFYYMADAFLRLGNTAYAVRAYEQAKQLAVSSREFEILENLRQQIEFYKEQ